MTTRRSLGELLYLRIWHDNTGMWNIFIICRTSETFVGIGDYASWFLGAVIFRDVQTGKKYQFANDRWLAVEYTDGEVRRLPPFLLFVNS